MSSLPYPNCFGPRCPRVGVRERYALAEAARRPEHLGSADNRRRRRVIDRGALEAKSHGSFNVVDRENDLFKQYGFPCQTFQ